MPLEPQVTPTRLAASERAVSTAVAATSLGPVPFLAADVNRKGFTVYNAATGVLFLKLGPGASESSYTLQVAAGGYFETPFGYVGIVTGVWAVDLITLWDSAGLLAKQRETTLIRTDGVLSSVVEVLYSGGVPVTTITKLLTRDGTGAVTAINIVRT